MSLKDDALYDQRNDDLELRMPPVELNQSSLNNQEVNDKQSYHVDDNDYDELSDDEVEIVGVVSAKNKEVVTKSSTSEQSTSSQNDLFQKEDQEDHSEIHINSIKNQTYEKHRMGLIPNPLGQTITNTGNLQSLRTQNNHNSYQGGQIWYSGVGVAHTWDPRSILPSFEPTWQHLLPIPLKRTSKYIHAYKLSLLSNKEFTIAPVQHVNNPYDFVPPIKGMRKIIKQITKHSANHGERAIMDGDSWRIPLAAYRAFYQYLSNEPNTYVQPIPEIQLTIASMGRAIAERGFPTEDDLVRAGVPLGLARALAPYQRGGVDFILQRGGMALIADEMGLGKTVQSIAAMSCYNHEWPILVLTPSTARFHWKNQFLKWLGVDSAIHNIKRGSQDSIVYGQGGIRKRKLSDLKNTDSSRSDAENCLKSHTVEMKLLNESEIHVVKSAKEQPLQNSDTKVVIVSFGLIVNLIHSGLLVPGQFKCVIVDESHMLKNKKSKRTIAVTPILLAANRINMLSGTPALSRPAELFPQIRILGRRMNVFQDEKEFEDRYVKDKYSDPSYKELHTMLTNTVMIRRMKEDQLKDIPKKRRENVYIHVENHEIRRLITEGLFRLRQGIGQLGKLSLLYQKDLMKHSEEYQDTNDDDSSDRSSKSILNQIYKLTGDGKIPILVKMLKRWLQGAGNGKLVIFAHHLNVLNAIEEMSGLSNNPDSSFKYIRIDGSTSPCNRQDRIDSFQDDPSIRVALLGITAAGVGVTLTAASTVWFAELFWTPAMMIQAEDRCHRIGQNATVRCLYIIAKGTIDDLLWILLQKKFRALGEFVEGEEEQQLVVNTTYQTVIDAVDRVCGSDVDIDSDSDTNEAGGEIDVNILVNDSFIVHDLEELADEDVKASIIDDNEDDSDEAIEDEKSITIDSDVKSSTSHQPVRNNDDVEQENKASAQSLGSENDPICILEDDNDFQNDFKSEEVLCIDDDIHDPPDIFTHMDIRMFYDAYFSGGTIVPLLHPKLKFPSVQYYYMDFLGQSYGLKFIFVCGRIIIQEVQMNKALGAIAGDILVRYNSTVIPFGTNLAPLSSTLKQEIRSGRSVRLYFARDQYFFQVLVTYFQRVQSQKHSSAQDVSDTIRE